MNKKAFSFSKILFISLVTIGVASAQAQSIYRCGQGAAKTYSDRPCADGTALPKTAAVPTEAERAEAQRVADRERQHANDLERARLTQERAAKPVAVGMDTRLRVKRSAPTEPIRIKKTKPIKLHASPSASKPSR